MFLSNKTLEKLRLLLNEETEHRTGAQLVKFFNDLGFSDTYTWDGGFPSRSAYTDDRLNAINGKPELDQCIKNILNPINFISKIEKLDNCIYDFNRYLVFDGWNVIRKGKEITFIRAEITEAIKETADLTENDFIKKYYEEISIEKLSIPEPLLTVLNHRINEIKLCMQAKSSLAAIFLCGSTLEGLLLYTALQHPSNYNQAKSAPKDNEGNTRKFQEWSLNNLIDVSYELGYIKEDVKKFSHALRDFRNYIHPYQQMVSKFDPDEHTATICFQVLRAVIYQIGLIK